MNWLKSNPILAACILVILVSLLSFYWLYRQGDSFRTEIASRQQQISKIQQLKSTTVPLPPAEIDAPPTEVTMVVNDAAINKLQNVYQQLENEYSGIFDSAVRRNRYGHNVMLTGLFPEASNDALLYNARDEYLLSFEAMYQALDAGTKPSPREIASIMSQESSFLQAGIAGADAADMTEAEREEMNRRQAEKLVQRYRDAALNYHVYAEPLFLDASREIWRTGPFQIGEWAKSTGPRPEMGQIWEGQMELWIQQDLVEAIRTANHVEDEPDASLVNLPIKRVLGMIIKPGYVGVPAGGAFETPPSDYAAAANAMQTKLMAPIPGDFTASPTGRVSNPLYDVRHAELSIIVDSRRIPEVINAINRVNFMSVIGMEMNEVDEYEALREGYYYGPGDVVQLDLTIETIWFRSWTAGDLSKELVAQNGGEFYAGLMPDVVRYHLGMPPRAEDFNPEEHLYQPGNGSFAGERGGAYGPDRGGPGQRGQMRRGGGGGRDAAYQRQMEMMRQQQQQDPIT